MSALADRPAAAVFELHLTGTPAGSGSKTVGVRKDGSRFYRPASKKTKPWMAYVEAEARKWWAEREPLDGPLHLLITYYVSRPQSHYRKDGRLAASAPQSVWAYRRSEHDLTKLDRALEDALQNGGVIKNDRRIVSKRSLIRYAEREQEPHTIVEVYCLV